MLKNTSLPTIIRTKQVKIYTQHAFTSKQAKKKKRSRSGIKECEFDLAVPKGCEHLRMINTKSLRRCGRKQTFHHLFTRQSKQTASALASTLLKEPMVRRVSKRQTNNTRVKEEHPCLPTAPLLAQNHTGTKAVFRSQPQHPGCQGLPEHHVNVAHAQTATINTHTGRKKT